MGLERPATIVRGLRLAGILGLFVILGVWTLAARGWTPTQSTKAVSAAPVHTLITAPQAIPRQYVVFQPINGGSIGPTTVDKWLVCDPSATCTTTRIVDGRYLLISRVPALTPSSGGHKSD